MNEFYAFLSVVVFGFSTLTYLFLMSKRQETNLMELASQALDHLNAKNTTEKTQAKVWETKSAVEAELIKKTSPLIPSIPAAKSSTEKVVKDAEGNEYDLIGYGFERAE